MRRATKVVVWAGVIAALWLFGRQYWGASTRTTRARHERPSPLPEPPVAPAPPEPLPAPAEPPPVIADPAPPAPRIAPGKPLSIALSGPPALWYAKPEDQDSDDYYGDLVRELSGGRAVYDPGLSRAAQELVYQTTELGDIVPSDVREFVVASSGAVAADSTFQQIRTTADGPEPLRKAIESVVGSRASGQAPMAVGVGEVYRQGLAMPRHIGVVGTRVGLRLDPTTARVEPGQTWTLSGRLLVNWRELHALVLRSDGSEDDQSVALSGQHLRVEVPAGTSVGWVDVDLDGEGPTGPGKLLQVRVWVGRDPPRQFTTRAPADESRLAGAADAEAYVFSLINRDRAEAGLGALGWDRRLAEVARGHSEDMRDHGYFAHLSPTTGLTGDRLRRVGWRSAGYAENVAHNATLSEAEAGLLHSLGHRRNLLSRDLPLCGVGVAIAGKGGDRRFWVTQVFAKPAVNLSPAQLESRVADLLAQRRAEAGLAALAVQDALSAAARQGAEVAAAGRLDGASGRALEVVKERDLLRGRMRAWAVLTGDLDKLQLPPEALDPSANALGIGAANEPGEGTRFAIVLLIQQGQAE